MLKDIIEKLFDENKIEYEKNADDNEKYIKLLETNSNINISKNMADSSPRKTESPFNNARKNDLTTQDLRSEQNAS